MAKNELFDIEVKDPVSEVKDSAPEEKNKLTGEIHNKIQNKIVSISEQSSTIKVEQKKYEFKVGDEKEVKLFLKEFLETDCYNEQMTEILNEWIERKTYFFDMHYKEILLAEKYGDSTKISKGELLSNNGGTIKKEGFLKDEKYKQNQYMQNLNGLLGQNRGTIKKEDEKISRYRKTPKRLLFNNIELKRNKETLDMIISDTIQIEMKTAEAVNELLNDLLTKVMEVLDIRKENEEAIETFFKISHV